MQAGAPINLRGIRKERPRLFGPRLGVFSLSLSLTEDAANYLVLYTQASSRITSPSWSPWRSRALSSPLSGHPRAGAFAPAPGPAGRTRPGNPRPGESGPRFPIPGRLGLGIGNRGFPVSRQNRESGIQVPSPIPGKKSGIAGGRFGGSDSRFPSESEHQPQWTRNILSRQYHSSALTGSMRLLFRV